MPILNVATLARVMPKSFLSTKKVTGFTLLDPLNQKDIMYEKLEFPEGIFQVHSLYEDYVKYSVDKTTKRKLLRCLVCVTEDGIDVLIPFDVAGEFYIVQKRQTGTKNAKAKADQNACAYTLKQLLGLGVFTKPLVLKLLLGEHPTKPCGFTGVIKVFDIVKDWTVIAETLDGKRKMLELPVLPFPEFTPSTNGKDLLETGSLRSELLYMSGGAADTYSKEIKVKTSFQLEPQKKPPPEDDGPSIQIKPDIPPLKFKSPPPELKPKWTPVHNAKGTKSLPLDLKAPLAPRSPLLDLKTSKAPSPDLKGRKSLSPVLRKAKTSVTSSSPTLDLRGKTSPAKITKM